MSGPLGTAVGAWWRRLSGWIRDLWSRERAQLAPAARVQSSSVGVVFGAIALELTDDLQHILTDLATQRGVVVDTVAGAIEDYGHLRAVVMGPAATHDAVQDATLLGEAESALGAIIQRAPEVAVLAQVAGKRTDDRTGREAAGEAILELRDKRRALHELASAAIHWGASRSPEANQHMQQCAKRL